MAKILSKERVVQYSIEFRQKVVDSANELEVEAAQIASVLGLHPMMVYRWRQSAEKASSSLNRREESA